ncbi:MAG: hypothetical protein IKJ99_02910 [Oscillospiraceae bacterium]|nr:hypothetical protein [Oscillospiraceae bacterium]
MMGCGYCNWWDRVSDFSGICTCPDGRNCGEYVGFSETCGKYVKKVVPVKAEPEKAKIEYTPDPQRLDPSFLIQFVRQNSRFDADLLAKIIEEWKQFKKLGSCGECKHWEEQIAYCELNSYFVDHEGLCCSPAESPNWTMWEKEEFCSRFERRTEDGN